MTIFQNEDVKSNGNNNRKGFIFLLTEEVVQKINLYELKGIQ